MVVLPGRESPPPNYLINDMFFKDSLIGFVVGNDTSSQIDWIGSWQNRGRGVLLRSNDGGENWSVIVGDLPARLTAIHFKDGYGWAVGENGLILRTGDGSTWIDEKNKLVYPSKFELFQNYPNPFNPSTTIKYALAKSEHVIITVYNTLGQKIESLLDKPMPTGHYQINFNGQDLPSGVYYYRMEAGEYIQTYKMLLVK